MNINNSNTMEIYRRGWHYFIQMSGLSLQDIKMMKPSGLNKLIDTTICSNDDWSNRTKKLFISAVRSILDFEYDIILPRSKVRKNLKDVREMKSTKGELLKEQVIELLHYFERKYKDAVKEKDKITGLRNLILFKLLAGTGQRISDVLSIKVETSKKDVLVFIQQKSKNKAIVENPSLSEIQFYVSLMQLSDNDYLFANGLSRKPLNRGHVHRIISDAGKLILNIENLSCHWFRAYFITQLKKKKIDNFTIMSATGHRSEAMIRHYFTGKSKLENSTALLLSD